MEQISTRARVGRPSKLTPERIASIADTLRAGNTRANAAAGAEIHISTFTAWMRMAEEEGAAPELLAFSAAVKEAEREGEAELVAIIRGAAPRQWAAAAWLLERKHPESWSKKSRVEVSTDNTKADAAVDATIAAAEAEAARLWAEVESFNPNKRESP
jgi:transposase